MRPSSRPSSRETNTYSASKSAATARTGRPLGQAATTSAATPSAASSSLTTRASSSRSSSLPPAAPDGDALRNGSINTLGVVPTGRALGRVRSAASLRADVDWVFRGVSILHQPTISIKWCYLGGVLRVGWGLASMWVARGMRTRERARARLDAPLVVPPTQNSVAPGSNANQSTSPNSFVIGPNRTDAVPQTRCDRLSKRRRTRAASARSWRPPSSDPTCS